MAQAIINTTVYKTHSASAASSSKSVAQGLSTYLIMKHANWPEPRHSRNVIRNQYSTGLSAEGYNSLVINMHMLITWHSLRYGIDNFISVLRA